MATLRPIGAGPVTLLITIICVWPSHIIAEYGSTGEFTGSHNCVPMAFTAENPPAQAINLQDGSSITGAAFSSLWTN